MNNDIPHDSKLTRRTALRAGCGAGALLLVPAARLAVAQPANYDASPGTSLDDYLQFRHNIPNGRLPNAKKELAAYFLPGAKYVGSKEQNRLLLLSIWAVDSAPVSLASREVDADRDVTLTLEKPGSVSAVESGLADRPIAVGAAAATVSLGKAVPGIHLVRVLGKNRSSAAGSLLVGPAVNGKHRVDLQLLGEEPVPNNPPEPKALAADYRHGFEVFLKGVRDGWRPALNPAAKQFVSENAVAIGTGAAVCILMPTIEGVTAGPAGVAKAVIVDCGLGQAAPLAVEFVVTLAGKVNDKLLADGKLTPEQHQLIKYTLTGVKFGIQIAADKLLDRIWPNEVPGDRKKFCDAAKAITLGLEIVSDVAIDQATAKVIVNAGVQQFKKVVTLLCNEKLDATRPPSIPAVPAPLG
jgi:hypothetical protein